MFTKILIANRGEIAVRVIGTCRKLGIATVAVYSEADRNALHTELADEAVCIGAAPAAESYLNGERVLKAALDSGAEAIHPGYGFLSENAAFARSAKKVGLVFIGPPEKAIRDMGDKARAKTLMEKAGVPLIPGYHGEDQDPKTLLKEAEKIGFPVLLKAAAGGGGKGMRVVENKAQFQEALDGAKREAMASFGNDTMIVEKYLTRPRHIEVQVFSDMHRNHLHLFERDCSVQRRHQKIIEEAPAPGLSDAVRKEMGKAAISAAKIIKYIGAGTVEFLLDAEENFYFMEMNTRLQVEHPVTEMITGLDLVEWQLRVAAGEELPKAQKDIKPCGHAIEARIYAEDPDNNFLPSPGKIQYLRFPVTARTDTGVRSGDSVSPYYDPMIAKLIVTGKTRKDAVKKLDAALAATRLAGTRTNIPFLQRVIRHPDFQKGGVSTRFIEEHHNALFPVSPATPPQEAYALAALGLLQERRRHQVSRPANDPWANLNNWRLNGEYPETFNFDSQTVQIRYPDELSTDNKTRIKFTCTPGQDIHSFTATLNGTETEATVLRTDTSLVVMYEKGSFTLDWRDPMTASTELEEGTARLTAPMPGKIVKILAKKGAKVAKGDPLVILEAMKMEHTITAPKDGIIKTVNANAGDQVDETLELVGFE